MIPELGLLALILALCLALVQASIPLAGAWRGDRRWMALARPAAWGQFTFLIFSFACLAHAFLTDDFSVEYVAQNSNSMLPWYYKFSAIWGAHEGSLLLWALILAGWTTAVSLCSRQLPQAMLARVLAVMGMISTGFLLFMIGTSNPFARLLPNVPANGRDLNPLLQDVGLIVHPPILYMGYVGFSVAFAFAIAALLDGKLDAAWARWSRPWTTVAWAFLGLGISLGSWWAYSELGWGSWWFWDPVENASFMPWLVGAALIHSLAATEKRGVFKSWTVLLAIAAFSLSLLGTFLVRSGVLTSVHAFATDPARGVFVLLLLMVVVGGSLALFALRAPVVKSQAGFGILSRETLLLINNLLLTVAAAMILLGTLYPMMLDALTGAKLSVGPPYFNAMFVPLMGLLMAAAAIGMLARWKNTPGRWLVRMLAPVLAASLLVALAAAALHDRSRWAVAGVCLLAAWIVLAGLRDIFDKTRHKGLLKGLPTLGRSYWGMHLGHLGFAVCALGVVLASTGSLERELRMTPGTAIELGGYHFVFEGTAPSATGPAGVTPAGIPGESSPADAMRTQNMQDNKAAFASRGAMDTQSAHGLQAPRAPDTLMAGTIVSAALVTGIKSDLPGDIIATVTEPVYDSATHQHVLIPQGSRLMGRYNSQVAYGQSRVQAVWDRIILPDTSSVTLDNLAAADPSGYAGLEDQVDWHWDRILAGAALTTLLGVGAELAAPENSADGDRIIIAGRDSLQDSVNQAGQEMTRRSMNIQPTLTARPGLPVRVIVNRDIALRPYRPLFINR